MPTDGKKHSGPARPFPSSAVNSPRVVYVPSGLGRGKGAPPCTSPSGAHASTPGMAAKSSRFAVAASRAAEATAPAPFRRADTPPSCPATTRDGTRADTMRRLPKTRTSVAPSASKRARTPPAHAASQDGERDRISTALGAAGSVWAAGTEGEPGRAAADATSAAAMVAAAALATVADTARAHHRRLRVAVMAGARGGGEGDTGRGTRCPCGAGVRVGEVGSTTGKVTAPNSMPHDKREGRFAAGAENQTSPLAGRTAVRTSCARRPTGQRRAQVRLPWETEVGARGEPLAGQEPGETRPTKHQVSLPRLGSGGRLSIWIWAGTQTQVRPSSRENDSPGGVRPVDGRRPIGPLTAALDRAALVHQSTTSDVRLLSKKRNHSTGGPALVSILPL